jgi:hypothetical protein
MSRHARGTPREPSSAEYNAPVVRRGQWLAAHPGATAGYVTATELRMAAVVDGTVLAVAYDDLRVLMDGAGKAEAEGRCPRHPADPA